MGDRCGNTIHTEYLTQDLRRCRKERDHEGHCLFGDGVPAESYEQVRAGILQEVRDALEHGYAPQGHLNVHPADYITWRFKLEGHENLDGEYVERAALHPQEASQEGEG